MISTQNLNIALLIKIIFVLFLIILNIYVYRNEKKIQQNLETENKFRQSGLGDQGLFKTLRQVINSALVLSAGYQTAVTMKNENLLQTSYKTNLEYVQTQGDAVKKRFEKLEDQVLVSDSKSLAALSRISEDTQKILNRMQKLQDDLTKSLSQSKDLSQNNSELMRLLEEKNAFDKRLSDQLAELAKDVGKIENESSDLTNYLITKNNETPTAKPLNTTTEAKQIDIKNSDTSTEITKNLNSTTKQNDLQNKDTNLNLTDVKEKGIIPSEWLDFFHNLNGIGQFCITILIGKYVIMTAVFSITSIFYGEYLIKRFNLENNFPRIAKVIQLRRKFQKYYITISIISVILVVITETLLSFYILTL